MKKISLSVIIPTYNNEETITTVIQEADTVAQKVASPYEILVLNDGSSDKTKDILNHLKKTMKNLRVMTHAYNQGYGETIKELYYKAQKEWIFSVPGDSQIRPEELVKLLTHQEEADIIIGKRLRRQDPKSRLFESKVYNDLLHFLFGLHLTDVNSVRLMKSVVLDKIRLFSSSAFVDAELAIKAKRLGFHCIEVPINHQKEKKKGSGGSLRTIVPTVFDMIRFLI